MAVLTVAAAPSRGHVAPAVKENNRYLKFTALGNGIRLAYTVYIGEIPGQTARSNMDTDKSGELSDAESAAYAAALGESVRAALTVEVDGRDVTVRWDDVSVGLGSTSTNAGSFSVDLVTWMCLGRPDARGRHTLVFFDKYQMSRAGETELRVEESPGVRVALASMGEDGRPSQAEFKWIGAGGPTATLGYYLSYSVESDAQMIEGGRCPALPPEGGDEGGGAKAGGPEVALPAAAGGSGTSRRVLAIALAGFAVVVLAAGGIWWTTRRKG